MENVTFAPRDIKITSVFFRKDAEQVRFESYPRRLVYGNREYVLVEN